MYEEFSETESQSTDLESSKISLPTKKSMSSYMMKLKKSKVYFIFCETKWDEKFFFKKKQKSTKEWKKRWFVQQDSYITYYENENVIILFSYFYFLFS